MSQWPGSTFIVPLPGSLRLQSLQPGLHLSHQAPEEKSQYRNSSSCLFFAAVPVLAGFGSSVWEHLWKMVSLNACKMNINVLTWETSQCEMNRKMRECGIVLPSVHGWDIYLGAKFRDILRYKDTPPRLHLCPCPCSCLPGLVPVPPAPLPARGYLGLGSEWSHL